MDDSVKKQLVDLLATTVATPDKNEVIRQVATLLTSATDVESLTGMWSHLGSGAAPVGSDSIPTWLYQRARDTSPDQAVNELLQWLKGGSQLLRITLMVGTLQPTGKVDIDSRTSVEPATWQDLKQIYPWSAGNVGNVFGQITAALHVEVEEPKVFSKPNDDDGFRKAASTSQEALDGAYMAADQTVACLALAAECYVPVIARVVRRPSSMPSVQGGPIEPIHPVARSGKEPLTDPAIERFRRLLAGLAGLHATERAGLRLPFERLAAAYSRNSLADACIDVGVALENLLLPGGNTAELAYRLRLHAACLRGGSAALRLETFRTLKDFYRLRSKAAHTGQVRRSAAEETLMFASIGIARDVIESILRRGGRPSEEDWERIALQVP